MSDEKIEESTTPSKQLPEEPVAKILQTKKGPDYFIEYMQKSWGVKTYNLGHGDICWSCTDFAYDMVFDTKSDMLCFIKSLFETDPED